MSSPVVATRRIRSIGFVCVNVCETIRFDVYLQMVNSFLYFHSSGFPNFFFTSSGMYLYRASFTLNASGILRFFFALSSISTRHCASYHLALVTIYNM